MEGVRGIPKEVNNVVKSKYNDLRKLPDTRIVDEWGFLVLPENKRTSSVNSQFNKSQESNLLKLFEREKNWNVFKGRRKKLMRKICRNGIPQSLRAQVWCKLAGVEEIKEDGLFSRLSQSDDTLPIFEVIERDIHRCFPDHILFKSADGEGQKKLRLVLRAYALYNPEVGYCQGMGFIAGTMLMYMSAEDSFWLLAITIKNYVDGFYNESLSQVHIDALSFSHLLQKKNKKVFNLFKSCDITPLLYITQWFITFYTSVLPWETVLRVWDIFFLDGVKTFFRIGLAIIKSIQHHLLKECNKSDVLDFILHIPHSPYLEADRLIQLSLTINLKTYEINNIRDKVKKNK